MSSSKRERDARSSHSLSRFLFGSLAILVFTILGCSLVKTRPVQEMSDTSAAIKAAKEVQADMLAPVLYREANEWFLKAKTAYKEKDYEEAEEYATKARTLAEQAEFEVLKNPGATRVDPASDDSAQPQPLPTPTYDYPTPTPTPYDRAILAPSGNGGGSGGGNSGNGGSGPTQIQVPASQ